MKTTVTLVNGESKTHDGLYPVIDYVEGRVYLCSEHDTEPKVACDLIEIRDVKWESGNPPSALATECHLPNSSRDS